MAVDDLTASEVGVFLVELTNRHGQSDSCATERSSEHTRAWRGAQLNASLAEPQ